MKGTLFLKPLEYSLQVDGESWRQAAKVTGVFKIKNYATTDMTIQKPRVLIAYCDIKKVHAKNVAGFDLITETIFSDQIVLKPNSEQEFPFEFKLASDAPITEKNKSLYILYGNEASYSEIGQLQMEIKPLEIYEQILMLFENFYRFKVSSKKFKKGFIEVKMNPPGSSKELANVDELTCLLKMNGKEIDIRYEFKLRSLEAVGTDVSIQKKVMDFKQVWTARDYEMFGGSLNQDRILELIGGTVKQVVPKILY